MSAPGRPKREHRSAGHEGDLVSAAGRRKREHRSAEEYLTARGRSCVIAAAGLAAESRIAAGAGVISIAGAGDPVQLASALEQALAHGAIGLVSFGIAGALAPDLRPGTIIVGRAVRAGGIRLPADPAWTRALAAAIPGAVVGDVVGADAIAATPASKQRWREQTGAIAIDTESHVVGRVAQAYAISFAVVRAISDPVDRALPPAALVPLRTSGGVDLAAVLRSLAQHPAQLISLARTAADAAAAMRALSRGRRRLGPCFGHPDLGELLIDVT